MARINSILSHELLTAIFEIYFTNKEFSSAAIGSPLDTSASVLHVCTLWRKAATPALYNSIVLRKTGQANVLLNTFIKKSSLASYVKRLRVEGALNESLGKIAERTKTTVTELVISLDFHPTENLKGIKDLLKILSPSRVTIIDYVDGSMGDDVVGVLCDCVTNLWLKLDSFYFPGTLPTSIIASDLEYCSALGAALSKCATLHTLRISGDIADGVFKIPDPIFRLVWNSASVKKVVVQRLEGVALEARLEMFLLSCDRVQLKFRNRAPYDIPLSGEQYFGYKINGRDEADILERILKYSIGASPGSLQRPTDDLWMDPSVMDSRTVYALLRVCKSFRALILPLVVSTVRIRTRNALSILLVHLGAHQDIGQQIKTIVYEPVEEDEIPASLFYSLFKISTNVKEYHVPKGSRAPQRIGVVWSISKRLKELHALNISCPGLKISVKIFEFLPYLEILKWSGDLVFMPSSQVQLPERAALFKLRAKVLPLLAVLEIGHCDPSCFSMFEELHLPSLTTLRVAHLAEGFFGEKMLLKHGSKIQTLDVCEGWRALDATFCRNLGELELSKTIPSTTTNEEAVLPDEGHRSLRELRVHWIPSHDESSASSMEYTKLFRFIIYRKTLFPQLATIQVVHSEVWPVREYVFSVWYYSEEAKQAQKRYNEVTVAAASS